VGNTVYAGGSGLFHKNSDGHSEAFPDVCLSPPPPPAGPMPMPYPNTLQASDLTDGSKTVQIQGAETALEDASSISTSSGDEGGTQGGNVVTHKTKGKGYFMLWSLDVKIEGKGAGRHGDSMGQNCASSPMGAADIMAMVNKAVLIAYNPPEPCTESYDSSEHRYDMLTSQYSAVASGPCWQCGSTSPLGNDASGSPIPNTSNSAFTPDHQPPVMVRWYAGGCHKTENQWKRDFQDDKQVFPHCKKCSDGQGGLSEQTFVLAERHADLISGVSATSESFLGRFF
jgi:uncharacterized Zn-binding protein involved in type VI secretion